MANYKANEQIMKHLDSQDKNLLVEIYKHRCLNESQAYQYFYRKVNVRRAYTSEKISALKAYNLISDVDYGGEYPALFLTTAGVATVKALLDEIGFSITDILPSQTKWLLSSDLYMNPKILDHQFHLNQFALTFESYSRGNISYHYYDEKFMMQVSNFMMPDGIIELPDCYLFIEMDMGNEDSTSLAKKWNSYRTFLTGPKKHYSNKPIIMLFILEGVSRIEMRKNTILKSIETYLMDQISGSFDTYIGTPDEIHDIIKSKILAWPTEARELEDSSFRNIHQNFGFSMSAPSFLSSLNATYSTYARKLTPQRKIEIVDGTPQEFLIDAWLDGRLSMLKSMMMHRGMTGKIRALAGRPLPYIIIVPSERWIYRLMKKIGTYQPENVFFTTPGRLNAGNWNEALFCIDQIGNLRHYTDASLKSTVYERRLGR